MTKLLEQAIAKLSQLPETEQDSIAQLILDEIEDERKWRINFTNSETKLAHLAEEALKEFKRSQTLPLIF